MAVGDPQEIQRFHATSGRLTGWLSLLLAGVVTVAGLAYLDDGFPDWLVALAVLGGALAWTAMLRPALWVRDEEVLVLRNMFDTIEIRLAAVEELAIRQVLAVRAGDRRWISSVVGRTWRKALTNPRRTDAGPHDKQPYADFVEDRLHALVEQARAEAGVRPGSPEQLALPDAVRRRRDWVPIGLVAAAALALLLTILL